MTPAVLSQLFLLYTWFALGAIIFFLLLIARFYERFSGERTRFRLFILPIILYGAAAVRYAAIDQVGGDVAGDVLLAGAGMSLAVVTLRLGWQMLRGQKGVQQ